MSPGTILLIPLLDRATDATEVHANLAAGGAAARKAAEARAARAKRAAAARAAAAAKRKREAAARAAKAAAAKAAAQAAREKRAAATRAAKAAREQAARKQAARKQAARDKAARDKAAREQAARDKAARAQAAREKHAAAAKAPAHPAPAPEVAAAPTGPTDPVIAATVLYHHGAYQKTVETLRAFLAGHPKAPAEARARRLLAFALVALGRRGEALEQFQRLLALDPKTTLDPRRTSPKILRVFDQARHAGG